MPGHHTYWLLKLLLLKLLLLKLLMDTALRTILLVVKDLKEVNVEPNEKERHLKSDIVKRKLSVKSCKKKMVKRRRTRSKK